MTEGDAADDGSASWERSVTRIPALGGDNSSKSGAVDDVAGTPRAPFVVGLDVGGTKTLALLVDAAGRIVGQLRRPTDASGPESLLASVVDAVTQVVMVAGVPVAEVAAVGVGVPGLVDPKGGTVHHAVNLGVGEMPLDLAGPLGKLIGEGPVVVANDANLAALGAAFTFEATGDVAYLSIGTGVAAGFVLRGQVHAGAHGLAGEIGHLPVDPFGPVCECGQRGCLETVASGQAIARRWQTDDGEPGDSAGLLAAASRGDERAIAVRDDVCNHIAAALALIAQTVDPDLMVVGGGVADAGQPLLDAVRAAIRRREATAPLLASLRLEDRVTIVPQGQPVGALGAVRAARQALAAAVDTDTNAPAVAVTDGHPDASEGTI